MGNIADPPTYAPLILQSTGSFNPIWLQWLTDLVSTLNQGGGTSITHNNLSGLQGGGTGEYFHLTAAQDVSLTNGGATTLHYHSADRSRSNHTGTQLLATISDAGSMASQSAANVNITGGTVVAAIYPVVGAESALTVDSSPFTYQHTGPRMISILVNGGTVSKVEWSRDGVTFYTVGTATNGMHLLSPQDYIKVTYSSIPTMTSVQR